MAQTDRGLTQATSAPERVPQQSSNEEITEFYKSAYRRLFKSLASQGATDREAEDAVSAAMVEVVSRWQKIANPLPYAYRAAKSHFLKAREISKRQVEEDRAPAKLTDGREFTACEDQQWIDQEFARLPPAEREVMQLIVAGFKPTEIAELLEKTPEAVRQAKHSASERIKRRLAEEGQLRRDRTPSDRGGRTTSHD